MYAETLFIQDNITLRALRTEEDDERTEVMKLFELMSMTLLHLVTIEMH
jgi:hypothetical protein